MAQPIVIQWVLDTRKIWTQAATKEQLPIVAGSALRLLPPEERIEVLRYLHAADGKMSLGSKLLKRYAISRFCGVPWRDARHVPRDERGKPVFRAPDGSEPLAFNVSHQAGLVVLLAVVRPPPGLALGVDVVCAGERRDRDRTAVAAHGWPAFVDIYAEVLPPSEVARLKALPLDGDPEPDVLLRWFYALWCLREAYVKMTGDALLADWLRELELRDFAPPPREEQGEDGGGGGASVQDVWLSGSKVEDVAVHIEDLLDGYMVATAVRHGSDGQTVELGRFKDLSLDEVIRFAEADGTAAWDGR